jgi:sulfate adenylyltransferase subunit 1 (EFTu-like GTPase family)
MSWYEGPSLLKILESVPAAEPNASDPFRFAVQRVLRPNQYFRGFAGQISGGIIRPGDPILVLPSRLRSRIQRIVTFGGNLSEAYSPQSVTLTLTDDIDISRGNLIVSPESPAVTINRFTASIVWMDEQVLEVNRRYLLKHTSNTVQARVIAIRQRLDIATLEQASAEILVLNEIGVVDIESVQPLNIDSYSLNHTTGSFILIDEMTNFTVAAGMIRDVNSGLGFIEAPVSVKERFARWFHIGAHIHISGFVAVVNEAERILFNRGAFVVRIEAPSEETLAALTAAGALVITHTPNDRLIVTINGHSVTLITIEGLVPLLEEMGTLKKVHNN